MEGFDWVYNWTISPSAIWLFKDDAWRHTGILSTACYQKPVNRYLYLPLITEMPRHVLTGFVHAETTRYLKRNSAVDAFLQSWLQSMKQSRPMPGVAP